MVTVTVIAVACSEDTHSKWKSEVATYMNGYCTFYAIQGTLTTVFRQGKIIIYCKK
jgi:hypothetical protein